MGVKRAIIETCESGIPQLWAWFADQRLFRVDRRFGSGRESTCRKIALWYLPRQKRAKLV